MKIEQIYTKCLAQGSYIISSGNDAAVVDPIRDIEIYTQKASKLGVTIKYIFETHFHADFVSGHIDLADDTGAKIVFGPNAQPTYDAYIAENGEIFQIGNIKLKVLHTPGHTMESSTFVLIDENGKEHSIYTGDTLFIGDVGRPDLAVKSNLSKEDLAGYLYDSLQTQILPLNDDIIVYPGHGAGSACGKNMSKETFSTLGEQKKTNYALQAKSKEQFIDMVLDGLTEPPKYFGDDVAQNKNGYTSIHRLREKGTVHLKMDEFDEFNGDALILDTRTPDEFERGYISGSINVGLNGQFAIWAATLFSLSQPILLIATEDTVELAVTRLARVGFENILGFISINDWKNSERRLEKICSINPEDLPSYLKTHTILDVRQPGEFNSSHIDGAINLPLDELLEGYNVLDKNVSYAIHCAGGYRSMIAASILKSKGYSSFVNVYKGFGGLEQIPELTLVNTVCQTTLKKEKLEK